MGQPLCCADAAATHTLTRRACASTLGNGFLSPVPAAAFGGTGSHFRTCFAEFHEYRDARPRAELYQANHRR